MKNKNPSPHAIEIAEKVLAGEITPDKITMEILASQFLQLAYRTK